MKKPHTAALLAAELALADAQQAYDEDETDGEASGTTARLEAAEAAVDAARAALAASDEPRTFRIHWLDGSGVREEITASSMAEAVAMAQDRAEIGDWGNDKTVWVRAQVIDVDGSTTTVNTTVHPDEPECVEGEEHDWCSDHEIVGGIEENPGVWGHGGGVIITEACRRCGCARVTDTWATDPCTGEQGLTSVSYEPGRFEPVEEEEE